jgi:hypothetical protein
LSSQADLLLSRQAPADAVDNRDKAVRLLLQVLRGPLAFWLLLSMENR